MHYQKLIEAMARAIMIARHDGGCIVNDWQIEARDNPHVSQAINQATTALTALLAARPDLAALLCVKDGED